MIFKQCQQHVFTIILISLLCRVSGMPGHTVYKEWSIEEMHQAAEDVINFDQDSTFKLLQIAESRIQCLPRGPEKAYHQGENHLRWADYYWIRFLPQSKYHLQRAFTYFKEHPQDKKLAEAYYVKSAINYKEQNRELQMAYLDTSITYALRSKNPQIISTIYIMQSFYLQAYNLWQESFDKTIMAAEFAKKSGDSLPVSASYFILAQIKEHFNQLNEAEELFEQSIAYGKGHYDLSGVYRGYGSVLMKNGKFQESLTAFHHSMKLYSAANNYRYVMMIRVRIGEALLEHGKISQAVENFREMRKLEPSLPPNIHTHHLHFAKMFAHLSEEEQAQNNIKHFLNSYKFGQLKGEKVNLIKDLAEVYEILGHKEQAITYYKKWGRLKDSLHALTSQQELTDMENLYILEKSKNEVITAKNKALIASKRVQFILGGSLLVILILAGGAIYFIRLKAQQEKEKLLLQTKGTQLNQILTAQEDERKRLARELHDGVGQSLAALKMQLQMADDSKTSTRIIKKVNEICKEIRSLSHQMMPLILQENGLEEALRWLTDQCLVKNSVQVDLVIQGRPNRLAPEIETHLYRIAQELIANIVKHSNASIVGIQLLRPKGEVILVVEDNGVGFDADGIGQGIGLANIRSRIESINGEIEIQPIQGKGTYVHILVPVNEEERLTA